jgi:acetyl-CoA carboxylase alpha subunit
LALNYINLDASIKALTPETASSINTGQNTDQKAAALVRDLSALGLIPTDFIDKMIAEITPANIKKIFIVRNKENSDIIVLYHLALTIVKKPGGHAALASRNSFNTAARCQQRA